jgi:NADH-quinone oxidoreductase subunit C
MTVEELAAVLRERCADVFVARDEVTAIVDRTELLDTLGWLGEDDRLECRFLSSITATDWPDRDPRFWVSYDLRSIERKHGVRVRVGLPEEDPHVSSVTSIFPTANWLEREQYDFFGVVFDGHPNLERIMLPQDWDGHPLRKTEELGGVMTRYKGALVPPIDRRGQA